MLTFLWEKKDFNIILRSQWKHGNSSYQVRKDLATFCKLVARFLGKSCVKGLRARKMFKQIKFKVVYCELKEKTVFS